MKKKNSTRIVILGGGFGGAMALKRLHRYIHGRKHVEVMFINRENHFLFTPLLHEVATGSIMPENIVEPLRSITHCCNIRFLEAVVERVDCDKKIVNTSQGEQAFDIALVALGAETNDYGTPGVAEHCFTLKSLSAAVKLKNHVIECLEAASRETDPLQRKRLLAFVVVGGGATGVELSAELSEFVYGSIQRFYSDHYNIEDVSIIVLQKGGELLLPFSPESRTASLGALTKKRVEVRFGEGASAVDERGVHCSSGAMIDSATPIWVAGVRPSALDITGDVPRDQGGRVMVSNTLQLLKYPMVFAIGDIASCQGDGGKPLPQLAQVASRQGPWAADNIVRLLDKKAPKPFKYHSAGNLVSVGRGMAIAELPLVTFRGPFAWILWRTIYLTKLLTWSKRIQVGIDWAIGLFQARDISKWD